MARLVRAIHDRRRQEFACDAEIMGPPDKPGDDDH